MHSVKEWKHPDCYIGAEWYGWLSAGFGQSRDSDALESSNFQVAYDALKGFSDLGDADGDATVTIVREGHWAVGWVEWIAIHSSNTVALDKAKELCDRANDYPILDEEDFSRREDDECGQVWKDCFDPSERIRYFRNHSYTASSLTDLLQAIRAGSWYHAANMLHSPSDLIA